MKPHFSRLFALLLAAAIWGAAPIAAHAWVSGGVVVGAPVYYPAPAYYPPPPAYYPYPPPPGYPSAPSPQAYNGGMPEAGECREYSRNAIIAGERQTIYGHACREPDGKWHIVD